MKNVIVFLLVLLGLTGRTKQAIRWTDFDK